MQTSKAKLSLPMFTLCVSLSSSVVRAPDLQVGGCGFVLHLAHFSSLVFMSPGRPADIGLQLGKGYYPCSR